MLSKDSTVMVGYEQKVVQDNPHKPWFAFNTWAFTFGPCWFFYRNMFVFGTMLTLFYAACSYALYLSPLTPTYFSKISYPLVSGIGNIIIAFFADWIYRLHISKWRKDKKTTIKYGLKYGSIGLVIIVAIALLLFCAVHYSKEFKVRQIDHIIESDGLLSLQLHKRGLLDYYQGENGETLVFYTARKNLVNQLSYLAERGDNLEQAVNEGHTPLYIATAKDHLETMKVLLRNGAKVDGISRFVDDQSSTIHEQTALFAAALNGNVSAIQLLKAYGANMNFASSEHKPFITPIYSAISKHHFEAVKRLIELGADVNYVAKGQHNMIATPLICAVQFGDLAIVKLLVEQGANVNYSPNASVSVPLMIAREENKADIAEYLISQGAR